MHANELNTYIKNEIDRVWSCIFIYLLLGKLYEILEFYKSR
jgi:hypothetical protein